MDQKTQKTRDSYFSVGRVSRAQGLKGEIYVTLGVPDPEWAKSLAKFQLREGSAQGATFTVEKIRLYKHGLIIKAKEVSDRTQAEKLVGRNFLIPTDLLTSEQGETPYLLELLSFKVIYRAAQPSSESREIGSVVDFSFNGAQDLLVVETEMGRVEIPFVREFVLDVDYKTSVIYLTCPEELLDPQYWER